MNAISVSATTRVDAAALIRRVDIVAVAGKYSALKRQGREHIGLCPFHADHKPSFHVIPEKGFAHCMACGWTGDAIAIVRDGDRVGFKEACERLGSDRLIPLQRANTPTADRTPDRVTRPPPVDAAPPNMQTRQWGHPARAWEYRDVAGALLFYVARYNLDDGSKVTPQWTWGDRGDGQGFRWGLGHYQGPRPLYGLDRLAQRPKAPVLIVEGEKDADAGSVALPMYVVVTWPGGTNGVEHVDFTPLAGRQVVIWPDQDLQAYKDDHPAAGVVKPTDEQPGTDAANRIAAKLLKIGAKWVKVIDVTPDANEPAKASGWAVSDAVADGMETPSIIEWLKPRARVHPVAAEADSDGAGPQFALPIAKAPIGESTGGQGGNSRTRAEIDDVTSRWPFRILGYNRAQCFYMPRGARQIFALGPTQHRKENLIYLASLQFWEGQWPGRQGCDWTAAADGLIRASQSRGIFNERDRIRGRGAWLDEGRSVFHAGDFLLVDGQIEPIDGFASRFIYEESSPLDLPTAEPATTAEAHAVIDVCNMLRWEKPLSAYLLAGWCVIAPVCGVLPWRPGIWINGAAGSGKTTVIRDVVGPLLGNVAARYSGSTTAPGIEQSLGHDARPVILDEAEGTDDRNQARIRGILDLARSTSSDDAGSTAKGTTGGVARAFNVRTIFLFSSILTGLKGFADESRFTKLTLAVSPMGDDEQRAKATENYKALVLKIGDTFTPEFAAKLLMRTLDNLQTLRANVDIFTAAAASEFDRRIADQIGAMLAGAYLLHSTGRVSTEKAVEWIKGQDWSEHTAAGAQRDHFRLLDRLMEHNIRWAHGNSPGERAIGELVRVALRSGYLDGPEQDALLRCGFRVDREGRGLWVSRTHTYIKDRIVRGTEWANDHGTPLLSIPGSRKSTAAKRFGDNVARGVWLPVSAINSGWEGADHASE